MAERIRIDHGNFETVVKQLPDWKVPASVKRDVQRFLDDLALGKVNRGRKLPPERLLKYLYGWKFSSDMPDIYISRAGMASKNLDEKFTQTELSTVKSELVQIEQREKIKDERIRQMEESMRTFQQDVAKALKLKPSRDETEAALKRKISQNYSLR